MRSGGRAAPVWRSQDAPACATLVDVGVDLLTDLLAEMRAALSPDRVRAEALELSLYARDASVMEGRAGVVVFPLTTAEVQAAVRIARRHQRSIVPRGSGTGLA